MPSILFLFPVFVGGTNTEKHYRLSIIFMSVDPYFKITSPSSWELPLLPVIPQGKSFQLRPYKWTIGGKVHISLVFLIGECRQSWYHPFRNYSFVLEYTLYNDSIFLCIPWEVLKSGVPVFWVKMGLNKEYESFLRLSL